MTYIFFRNILQNGSSQFSLMNILTVYTVSSASNNICLTLNTNAIYDAEKSNVKQKNIANEITYIQRLSSRLGQKSAKRHFGLPNKLSPTHLSTTYSGGFIHSNSFIAERQARKLLYQFLKLFCFT